MRRITILLLITIILVAACSPGEAEPTVVPTPSFEARIGLVTDIGSVRDGTFSEFGHKGAMRAAEDYGLDYAYRESLADSHWATHMEDLLESGYNVIVTVGFFMTDFTLEQAAANPDVYFIGVDQFAVDPPDNFVGLQFQEDEGGFLAGVLAAMMTETDKVGVIGGEQIPPVEHFVEGFRNGAAYINPDVEALYVYSDSFIDAAAGRAQAQAWIDEDVDVFFGAGGLTGSSGIFEAAGQGYWVIGVDQDEYRTTFQEGSLDGADRVLTSALKRIDNGVYLAIESILNGTFEPGIRVLTSAECGIGYAPFHDTENDIPADVQEMLEMTWRAIAGGTLSTGASGTEGDVAPEPLAEGELPPVADDAPTLADCEG